MHWIKTEAVTIKKLPAVCPYMSMRDISVFCDFDLSHQVHGYLKSKLCSLYENDCIFDKFECCWGGDDRWGDVVHVQ